MGELLPEVKARGAALDFFSFHKYASLISWIRDDTLAVRKYLDACPEALYRILDAIRSHPDMDSESLAAMYNGQSGLPTVNKRIFENLREASVLGRI
jgi:hypothetical protein